MDFTVNSDLLLSTFFSEVLPTTHGDEVNQGYLPGQRLQAAVCEFTFFEDSGTNPRRANVQGIR